ncbi:MAG: hypothetical protein OEU92_09430 [Alphaproteobacteria bacterium]|nr:hypothetical protein [Alphaproteobacteria bacterium]
MAIGFKGYAVVSANGFIADDRGCMPEALRFEADWDYFQAALDAVDVTLLGRHTHEAAPNAKGRRRLVVSRGVHAVIQENASTWWVNPREVAPEAAVAVVSASATEVAVVGGTGVFGWILDACGYDAFHLSIAHGVRLGAGRPLFDGASDLDAAIAKLEDRGLNAKRRSWFDRDAGLELLILGRSPG